MAKKQLKKTSPSKVETSKFLNWNLPKWEVFFLIGIFLLSILLRWYRIPEHLFFGFEQGRDAQIIKDIYQKGDFQLVGPKTDLAGIFHGAYYYYVMAPAYALSSGNPVVGSLWLIILSSLIPVLLYFFGKSVFRSSQWAVVLSLFAAVSYEYIIYARWLSNVTPSPIFILFTFFSLWLYKEQKRPLWFILGAFFACLSAQFELVLIFLFGVIFLLYLATRTLPFPNWKTWLLAFVVGAGVFSPHFLFNLRNQNIMGNAIVSYLSGTSDHKKDNNISKAAGAVWHSYTTIFNRTLSLPQKSLGPDKAIAGFFFFVLFAGCVEYLWRNKEKSQRQNLFFFLVWAGMGLPVLFFADVALLYQLYVGVGMGILFLWVFALKEFSETPHLKGAKFLFAFLFLLFVLGWSEYTYKLHTNQDVFFITIQEGMNYADQKRALEYVHSSANGQIYRFEAFTIPYLQQEGWQYLQNYFYPNSTDKGSKLVFIAIEKQVDPFWEKKWIEELGTSTLIEEKEFGLLRIQKRQLQ